MMEGSPVPQPVRHNLIERAHRISGYREAAEDVLLRLATGHLQPVYWIEGLGAMGKTELALAIAWSIVERYADYPFEAIVWVSARTPALVPIWPAPATLRCAPTPHTVARLCQAIASVLKDTRLAAAAAGDPAEQLGMLRHVLGTRRILLVIDELDHVGPAGEGIFELLRTLPEPSRAIVTAREDHDDLMPVRLVGLRDGEMEVFLQRLYASEGILLDPAQARSIRRWTRGLPWAGRSALARIRAVGLTQALDELNREPLEFMAPVFGSLLRRLRTTHPASHAVLVTLARCDLERGLTRKQVLSVLKTDLDQGMDLLKPLLRSNLIKRDDHARGRFTAPTVVLWYARSLREPNAMTG